MRQSRIDANVILSTDLPEFRGIVRGAKLCRAIRGLRGLNGNCKHSMQNVQCCTASANVKQTPKQCNLSQTAAARHIFPKGVPERFRGIRTSFFFRTSFLIRSAAASYRLSKGRLTPENTVRHCVEAILTSCPTDPSAAKEARPGLCQRGAKMVPL